MANTMLTAGVGIAYPLASCGQRHAHARHSASAGGTWPAAALSATRSCHSSVIATGRPAAKMSQARDEEEERKRLLAIALAGDPLVLIDNVTGELGTSALDVALTSLTFKDRLLGTNENKEALLETWHACYGDKPQILKSVFRHLAIYEQESDYQRLQEALDGFCDSGKQEKKSRCELWGTCSKKWRKGSSTANALRIKVIAVEMAKGGGEQIFNKPVHLRLSRLKS